MRYITKRNTAYLSITVFLLLFCAGAKVYAAVDQDITDKYPTAEPLPEQAAAAAAPASVLDRFEFRGYVDIQQGYDNNVDLDPNRHKDGFAQAVANGEVAYSLTDKVGLKAGSDVFTTIYYKYNINNLIDVAPYVGLDYEITPDLISRSSITFDHFSYPNSKESTYSGIVLSTFLRYYFLRNVYQEAGFEYLRRWYGDRRISIDSGQRGNRDRVDDRYRVQYNLGMYLDRLYLRVSNELSINDSNDVYQQYYDFYSYRLRPSLMYFFTDKLYTDLSLIYKHYNYKDRRSTEDIDKKVRNDTFIFTSSLYYDLMKNLTLGVTYSYSENLSNDPFERYSGSIISGGFYISF